MSEKGAQQEITNHTGKIIVFQQKVSKNNGSQIILS